MERLHRITDSSINFTESAPFFVFLLYGNEILPELQNPALAGVKALKFTASDGRFYSDYYPRSFVL